MTVNSSNKTAKKGKRITLILFSLICTLIILFAVFVKLILPFVIVQMVNSENPPSSILPKNIQTTVIDIKRKASPKIKQLPTEMAELNLLGLSFEDAIFLIDNVESSQVKATINELNKTDIQTTGQVFDIAVTHIKVEGYDFKKYRSFFVKRVSVKRIKNALKTIERNDLMNSLSVSVGRATAKQILYDKKEKIDSVLREAKLRIVNPNP